MVQVKLYDFLYGNAGYLFLLCGGSPGGNPLKQIRYTVSTVLHLGVHQVSRLMDAYKRKTKLPSIVHTSESLILLRKTVLYLCPPRGIA